MILVTGAGQEPVWVAFTWVYALSSLPFVFFAAVNPFCFWLNFKRFARSSNFFAANSCKELRRSRFTATCL